MMHEYLFASMGPAAFYDSFHVAIIRRMALYMGGVHRNLDVAATLRAVAFKHESA